MLLNDHKIRVDRLLRGERKISDLHTLFSDLRMCRPGHQGVREVGHFAAHRDQRESGLSWDRVEDIQTSARLWFRQQNGSVPDTEHLRKAGAANLHIIPEDMIKEKSGISLQTASQSFGKAIRKFESCQPLKQREQKLLEAFGLSMMWQFAFNDHELWSGFVNLLVQEGSLAKEDQSSFETVSSYVTLYALNVMHGAKLKMRDGTETWLRLAKADDGAFSESKQTSRSAIGLSR